MQVKNISYIKDFFNLPIQSQQAKFLFGSLFKGSMHFLLIGLASTIFSWLSLSNVTANNFNFVMGVQSALGFAGLIAIMFMRYYWTLRVATVSKTFVAVLFVINFISNTAIFSILLTGLTVLDFNWLGAKHSSIVYQASKVLPILFKFVLIIFGTSFIVFAVPALIALIIRSRKVMASIFKVYFIASMIAFGLAIIMYIAFFVGMRNNKLPISHTINLAYHVLMAVFVLLSPMITIFRLRSLANVLNFNDPDLVSRWERFFVFQIMSDLLMIAYYIARLVAYSRSR